MTIVVYPEGYIREQIHYWDMKDNPSRHYLTKDKYSREETRELCPTCSINKEWNKKFEYDARTDTYYVRTKK